MIVAQADDPPFATCRAPARRIPVSTRRAEHGTGRAVQPPWFFRPPYQGRTDPTVQHEDTRAKGPAYAGNSRNPGSTVPAPLARRCVSKQTPRLLACFRWAFPATSRMMIGVLVPCETPPCAQSTSDVMSSRFDSFLVFVLILSLLFRCASPIRPLLSWMGPDKRASKSS